MVNIELMKQFYFANSENVPYSLSDGGTIEIKPILLKDALLYDGAKDVLLIRKNETNDIEQIQMSYLDFLVKKVFVSNEVYLDKLKTLMLLCFDAQYITIGQKNGKCCIGICSEDSTIKYIITSKDFDELSKIILNQNDPNFDDRYVNPDVREMMEEYYRVKYKDTTTPTLEKKKAFVSSKSNKTFKELNEIPYREFELIYKSMVDSEIYLTTKITEASYKYEVKEPTKHPLFTKETDPYSEIFEDTSVLSGKGISGAEQLNAMNLMD